LKDSFKVKRIRRNPRVRVAKCGVAGKLQGPWLDGSCVLVTDPAHEARAYDALNAKYGWQMRLGTLMRSLFGGLDKRCVLEITLDA
jgi:PPOX class probable F420-dependent enzyme